MIKASACLQHQVFPDETKMINTKGREPLIKSNRCAISIFLVHLIDKHKNITLLTGNNKIRNQRFIFYLVGGLKKIFLKKWYK